MSKRPDFIRELPDDQCQPITVEPVFTHILVFQWDGTGEMEHCVAVRQDKVLDTVAAMLDNYLKGEGVSPLQGEAVEFARAVVKYAGKEDEASVNQGCIDWLRDSLDHVVTEPLGKIGIHAMKIVRDCLK